MLQPLWKPVWSFLRNLNIKLLHNLAFAVQGIYPKELNTDIQTNRRRQWQPTPVLLPGKSHGQRSLVGCSPWGRQESDTTERLHSHFSLSRIGEGNGHPLQCSCLENPRDGGAWWAAIYGVAQSLTRLKRLSSSSIQTNTFMRMITVPLFMVAKRWKEPNVHQQMNG